MDSCHNRIAAVVVTYQPDPDHVQALFATLREQAQWLIVVDNGATMNMVGLLHENDVLIPLGDNLGLAAAQNIGIERALSMEAEFVYLSDQDSLPYPGMLKKLESAYRQNETKEFPIAAVGPITIDARTNTLGFWIVDRHSLPQQYQPKNKDNRIVKISFLIASGSLIAASVIRAIGGMRSAYFIDRVDIEWCLRAKASGFHLLGVSAAKLQHRLGDEVRRIWFFRWRQVTTHSPLRSYYMFRNTLLMLRDTTMDAKWRTYHLKGLAKLAVYFLVFTGNRWQRACLMTRGIWHGLRGVSGRLDMASGKCTDIPMNSLDPRSR
jgi:rhamnosyltransferase